MTRDALSILLGAEGRLSSLYYFNNDYNGYAVVNALEMKDDNTIRVSLIPEFCDRNPVATFAHFAVAKSLTYMLIFSVRAPPVSWRPCRGRELLSLHLCRALHLIKGWSMKCRASSTHREGLWCCTRSDSYRYEVLGRAGYYDLCFPGRLFGSMNMSLTESAT